MEEQSNRRINGNGSPTPTEETHRHHIALLEAKANRQKLKSDENWQFYAEKNDIKLYTLDIPGCKLPVVRGIGSIEGWRKEEVFAVITSPSCRKLWDDRFEAGEIVEKLGTTTFLSTNLVKGSFAVSGRDLCICLNVEVSPDTIELTITSVEDDKIPVNRQKVRAEMQVGSWILKEEKSEEGGVKVEAEYLISLDLKGSLPSYLIRSVIPYIPLCIAKIRDYLNTVGSPPFVVNKSKDAFFNPPFFDTKSVKWEVELYGEGHVEVDVGSRLASLGWDIDCSGEMVKLNDRQLRILFKQQCRVILTPC